MPYTLDDIEQMFKQGLLSPQDRKLLRQDLIQQANQEEGLLRKMVGHLSHEVTEGWKNLKAVGGEKEGAGEVLTANVQGVVGALQLLSSLPTALGHTAGESTQDFLLKRGANQHVAALAATTADIMASMVGGGAIGKAVKKTAGAAIGKATEAGREAALTASADETKKAVTMWLGKAVGIEAEKKAAKQTADIEAAEIIESVNSRVKAITNTQNLLEKASETVRGKEGEAATSTSQTLEAAYQTLLGNKSAEAVVNEIGQRTEVRRAVRELDKMVFTSEKESAEVSAEVMRRGKEFLGAPRGGLNPSRQPEIGVFARARQKFDEGLAKYEAGKINLKDLQEKAKAAQMSMNDVLSLKPGEAKTPLQIAEISQPVRAFGESFIKNVDKAEEGIAKGDYGKFWEALTDFHLMVEAHWPYMSPRQVAGQTVKTYDEPVLSATRFLQQVPKFSSWLGKLKMETPEEVEANAQLILREMQKIQSPSQISNFAKRTAETTAEQGDEVLKDPTFRDKARFWFVNSIMSGTDTIGRNLAGNTLAVPYHYGEKITSAVASKVLNPFLKPDHQLASTPISDVNAGMGIWFRTMWDATRYTLTRQFDEVRGLVPDEQVLEKLMGNRYDLPRFSTTGTTNPFTGNLGKVIGTPVGIAQMADEISRISAYRMSVGELAHGEFRASGSKLPWTKFFDDFMENVPPSVQDYGVRIANEVTFSDAMSRVGKVASMAREMLPGTEFLATFIRTLDRLTAFQYNRSPVLSILSTRLRDELNSGDGMVRADAMGRVILSSIMGAGTFAAARTVAPDGMTLITGGGPTDRQLAGRLKEAKIHLPYTVWTPVGRVPYAYLAPARGPLGLMADTGEIWDEVRPDDAETLWSGIVLAGTRNFFDMTYTKQFADVFSIWDKPERGSSAGLSRITANIVRGFLEPSIVRQMMREADPTVKESGDFFDELTRDIPGYGGPPRRNPLTGEPVMNPPRLLQGTPLGWFLPTSPIQPASDAFANKIRELQLKVPEFPESFAGGTASESPFAYTGPLGEAREAKSGVPIPKELRQKGIDYMHSPEMFGKTLSEEANEMVSDPEFNKLAPIDQADAITGLYHARISPALDRLKEEHPELLEAYELKVQKRAEVRMPPEEREAFEQTIEPVPEPVPLPEFQSEETVEP